MDKRIMIVSDRIGDGDDELGRLLMRNFIYALARSEPRPVAVGFMNGGVRLVCEGSEVLDDVSLMAENGVMIKACGTCLDYLGLAEKLVVGEVGTMPESVASIMADGDLVTVG